MASQSKKKNIVIVGGGFGGLNVAKNLISRLDQDITLIDRRNYHLFQPLLYQIAMAGLSPADIAVPIRGIFSKNKQVEVLLANVDSVDLKNAVIKSDIGEINYNYLVLACGSKHSYFGNEKWEPFAPGLKTLEQATEIRRRILTAFETAETEDDEKIQDNLLTFVIIGGGPTGVELAGAIAEISFSTLKKDFRRIDPRRSKIILVEAGPRILSSFSFDLSVKAKKALEGMGVQVKISSKVTNITEFGVHMENEFLPAKTILWAAGVKPSSVNCSLGVKLDKDGKVKVEKDLSLKNYPNVFVIGDQAHFEDENEKTLPGLAPVALQQGKHVALNIQLKEKNQATQEFRYSDKGHLATIGRRIALLEYGAFKTFGTIAWILWLLVHILYLIGFKNRVFVLLQWMWQYFGYRRGARLIVQKEWRAYPKNKEKEFMVKNDFIMSKLDIDSRARWESEGGSRYKI